MKIKHIISVVVLISAFFFLTIFGVILVIDEDSSNSSHGTGGSLSDNALIIYRFYSEKGLDDLHIASILGNLYQESRLDPTLTESTGEGIGLVQWSFGRKQQLISYCSTLGVLWSDINAQLNFSWLEFDLEANQASSGVADYQWIYNDNQRSKKAFEEATTIEEATTNYCHGFERCGRDEATSHLQSVRIPKAKEYYQLMQSGGGMAGQFDDKTVQEIMNEALKYEGFPYVFGGASPSTSFDCSGLVQWCYGKAGIQLPRVAQAQYDATTHLPLSEAKAGDLIFFHSTYNSGSLVSHVGIYVGDNKMFHAGSPIGYADLNSSYWQAHLIGAGRVINK